MGDKDGEDGGRGVVECVCCFVEDLVGGFEVYGEDAEGGYGGGGLAMV